MLKIIFLFISLFLGYLVFNQLIDTALTSFRWQVKGETISNILGTPIEAWWSESPIIIAINLSLEDFWFVAQMIGTVGTWTLGRIFK